ncbi:MAG: carboxypeptidase-like regulatory domain-containing protein [Candidatus Micrarchaeota archaeon]|nr:carboxypeptidase-like regulatory domain-containing protein [Candidatus Micrarchaeota archaeon]
MPLPEFLERIKAEMEARGIPFIALPAAIAVIVIGVIAYFLLSAAPTTTAFRLNVMSGGEPISGATVEVYDENDNLVDAAVSDESGLVSFDALPAKRLKFKVLKTGLEEIERFLDLARTTFTKLEMAVPSPTPQPVPYATPVPPNNKKGNDFKKMDVPEYGKLVVSVADEKQKPLDATVYVYDAESGAELRNKKASKGVASFSDIEVGTRVTVAVKLSGYLPYPDSKDEDNEVYISDETVTKDITLKKTTPANSAETVITVEDDSGNPVAGATAGIYIPNELAPVEENKTDSRGKFAANLSLGVPYYAVAFKAKAGLLPNASLAFSAGEKFTLTLSKATADNSAKLTVNTTDEYLKPLRAVAKVFTEFGQPITDAADTGKAGVAVFDSLPRGWTVVAMASSGEKYGSEKATLSGSSQKVDIVLDVHYANLTLSAADALTGSELPAAAGPAFRVYWKNALSAECSGQNCTADVKSETEIVVEARATGYFPANWTVKAEAGKSTRMQVTLVPTTITSDSLVTFNGIYEKGKTIAGKIAEGTPLVRGRSYMAQATLFVKGGADEGGLIARTSEWIVSHLPSGSLVPFTAGTAAPAQACSGTDLWDTSTRSYSRPAKWISLKTPTKGTTVTFTLEISVDPLGKADNFMLELASFAKSAGKWSRNPFDPVLGVAESAGAKGWCQAQATQFNYSIKSPNVACDENACLEVVYYQGGYLCGPQGDTLDCTGAVAETGLYVSPLVAEWKLYPFKDIKPQLISLSGATAYSWSNIFGVSSQCTASCSSAVLTSLSNTQVTPVFPSYSGYPDAEGEFTVSPATGSQFIAVSFNYNTGKTLTKTTQITVKSTGVPGALTGGQETNVETPAGKVSLKISFQQQTDETWNNVATATTGKGLKMLYSITDTALVAAAFNISWNDNCLLNNNLTSYSNTTAAGNATGEITLASTCTKDNIVTFTIEYKGLSSYWSIGFKEAAPEAPAAPAAGEAVVTLEPPLPNTYEIRLVGKTYTDYRFKLLCLNPAGDVSACACNESAGAINETKTIDGVNKTIACETDAIRLNASSILPADAVYLIINVSALPAVQRAARFNFKPTPYAPANPSTRLAKCFEVNQSFPGTTAYSATTGLQIVLLKFNTVGSGCAQDYATIYGDTKAFTESAVATTGTKFSLDPAKPNQLTPVTFNTVDPQVYFLPHVNVTWNPDVPDVFIVPVDNYLNRKLGSTEAESSCEKECPSSLACDPGCASNNLVCGTLCALSSPACLECIQSGGDCTATCTAASSGCAQCIDTAAQKCADCKNCMPDCVAKKNTLKFNMAALAGSDNWGFQDHRLWLLVYAPPNIRDMGTMIKDRGINISSKDKKFYINYALTRPQVQVFAAEPGFTVEKRYQCTSPNNCKGTNVTGAVVLDGIPQSFNLSNAPFSSLLFYRGNVNVTQPGETEKFVGLPFAAFSDTAALVLPGEFTEASAADSTEKCGAQYEGKGLYSLAYQAQANGDEAKETEVTTGPPVQFCSPIVFGPAPPVCTPLFQSYKLKMQPVTTSILNYSSRKALYDTSSIKDYNESLCGGGYVECGPALLVLPQTVFGQLTNVFDDGKLFTNDYSDVDQPVPQPFTFHMHLGTCMLVKYLGWGRNYHVEALLEGEDQAWYWQTYSFYNPISDTQNIFNLCPKDEDGDCKKGAFHSGLYADKEEKTVIDGPGNTGNISFDSPVYPDKKMFLSLKTDLYDTWGCDENYRILHECIYSTGNDALCNLDKNNTLDKLYAHVDGSDYSEGLLPPKFEGCYLSGKTADGKNAYGFGAPAASDGLCQVEGNDVEEVQGTGNEGCDPDVDEKGMAYTAGLGLGNKFEEYYCSEESGDENWRSMSITPPSPCRYCKEADPGGACPSPTATCGYYDVSGCSPAAESPAPTLNECEAACAGLNAEWACSASASCQERSSDSGVSTDICGSYNSTGDVACSTSKQYCCCHSPSSQCPVPTPTLTPCQKECVPSNLDGFCATTPQCIRHITKNGYAVTVLGYYMGGTGCTDPEPACCCFDKT